jgi:hypothetical protein
VLDIPPSLSNRNDNLAGNVLLRRTRLYAFKYNSQNYSCFLFSYRFLLDILKLQGQNWKNGFNRADNFLLSSLRANCSQQTGRVRYVPEHSDNYLAFHNAKNVRCNLKYSL